MGCGPSKDANVATGNTVSLLKKNPGDATSSSSPPRSAIATEDTSTVVDKAEEPTGKGGNEDVVQVKDVAPPEEKNIEEEEEEEGKSIATGSPDRYFSSRKDEEAVAGVTASPGCYSSPTPESIADLAVEAVVPLVNIREEAEAEEKKVSDGIVDGEEIASKKQGLNVAGESRETVVVEEEKKVTAGDQEESA